VDFNKAIHLQSDNVHAYSGRGYAKCQLADYQGAIADFNESIRLQPDYVIAYNGRGRAKSNLGDNQGAILDYQAAMRFCQQKGDTKGYCETLKQIEDLEKQSKGFWKRLFS
jgi:tetratricopeptide (TPR) repeat protein